MKNDQGDVRGYRPQPTGSVPVVRPSLPQQPGYPPQAGEAGYPQPTQPTAPTQQQWTGSYVPQQSYPQSGQPMQPQQWTGSYVPPQGYPQNGQQPMTQQWTGSYPPQQQQGYQPMPQQNAGTYNPQQPYPQGMQPQQPYTPQDQQQMDSLVQPSVFDRIRAIIPQLDLPVVMLLAAGVLGLAYALFVTISFSWLTKLIPHLLVVWLTVIATCAACVLRQKRIALAACAGYVLSILLFLNYFYLLLPQPILCGLAFWHMEE